MSDKTILAILDPTNRGDQPVVARAAWLAKRVSASLELFICDYDGEIERGVVYTVWIQRPDAKEQLLAIHRDRLEAIAEPLRSRGLEVSVDVAWDYPLGAALVRKVIESKPWLVAKDTHHHNVLKRTLLSNTDWHLIRDCPAPLLLVKPDSIPYRPKVFAAIDPLHAHDKPGRLDEGILERARLLAGDIGGELHVVHSFYVPMELGVSPDLAEQIEQQHRTALEKFMAAHAVPPDRVHLVRGRADQLLPEVMERETAERVLDRLPCDLLIVKPEWYARRQD